MNIGNPNDWENPCNRCNYNISDYDIVYNKAIDDFVEELKDYFVIPHDVRVIEMKAEQLKAGGENE